MRLNEHPNRHSTHNKSRIILSAWRRKKTRSNKDFSLEKEIVKCTSNANWIHEAKTNSDNEALHGTFAHLNFFYFLWKKEEFTMNWECVLCTEWSFHFQMLYHIEAFISHRNENTLEPASDLDHITDTHSRVVVATTRKIYKKFFFIATVFSC